MSEQSDRTKQSSSRWVAPAAAVALVVTIGLSAVGFIAGFVLGPALAYLLNLCSDPFLCMEIQWFLLGACVGFLVPFVPGVLLTIAMTLALTRRARPK